MKKTRFLIYQDTDGKWRWRWKGRNGRIIQASSEGFCSRWEAKQNIMRLIAGARSEYEIVVKC